MLGHEHTLVSTRINEAKYIHCITCGTIYCRLCGKSLDAGTNQNHEIDKLQYKHRRCILH